MLRLARLELSSAAVNLKGAGAWKLAGAAKTVLASVDKIDEAAREKCILGGYVGKEVGSCFWEISQGLQKSIW